MYGSHVSPHVSHGGELLTADGAARLAAMLLHVLDEVSTLEVLCTTCVTFKRAICGKKALMRNGERGEMRLHGRQGCVDFEFLMSYFLKMYPKKSPLK